MVQAVSELLNQIKSQDDDSRPAQRSSLDRGANLRKLLKLLISKVKAQASQGNIAEAQNDKIALAQLYIHLLENKVQEQDYVSDEDKAEIQSLISGIKDAFSTFGNKLKGGFNTFGSKVKDLFNSIG